jgi:hypothetical protein
MPTKRDWIELRNRVITDRFNELYKLIPFGDHGAKANIVLACMEMEFFMGRQNIMKIVKSGAVCDENAPLFAKYQQYQTQKKDNDEK